MISVVSLHSVILWGRGRGEGKECTLFLLLPPSRCLMGLEEGMPLSLCPIPLSQLCRLIILWLMSTTILVQQILNKSMNYTCICIWIISRSLEQVPFEMTLEVKKCIWEDYFHWLVCWNAFCLTVEPALQWPSYYLGQKTTIFLINIGLI